MDTSTDGRKAKLLTIRDFARFPSPHVPLPGYILETGNHFSIKPCLSSQPSASSRPLVLPSLPCPQSQLLSRLPRLLTNTSSRPSMPRRTSLRLQSQASPQADSQQTTRTNSSRNRLGCHTCRIRRKKCDERKDPSKGGSCDTCLRLNIECLGWGPSRPAWCSVRFLPP